MYIPKTLQEENVHSNCLMGLIFSTSWRVAPTKIFFLIGHRFFFYRVGLFWGQPDNSPIPDNPLIFPKKEGSLMKCSPLTF